MPRNLAIRYNANVLAELVKEEFRNVLCYCEGREYITALDRLNEGPCRNDPAVRTMAQLVNTVVPARFIVGLMFIPVENTLSQIREHGNFQIRKLFYVLGSGFELGELIDLGKPVALLSATSEPKFQSHIQIAEPSPPPNPIPRIIIDSEEIGDNLLHQNFQYWQTPAGDAYPVDLVLFGIDSILSITEGVKSVTLSGAQVDYGRGELVFENANVIQSQFATLKLECDRSGDDFQPGLFDVAPGNPCPPAWAKEFLKELVMKGLLGSGRFSYCDLDSKNSILFQLPLIGAHALAFLRGLPRLIRIPGGTSDPAGGGGAP